MFILIVVVVGLTSWMQTARIVRGEILALKEREFILAARSIGTSLGRYHSSPPTAKRGVTYHGLRNTGTGSSHHNRKRTVLFRRRLPIRFPNMGQNAG